MELRRRYQHLLAIFAFIPPIILCPLRTNAFHISMASPPLSKTAVILNVNARSVSPSITPIANSIFGQSNVFVTSTVEDAKMAAKAIVSSKDYALVVPVGGDGTLSTVINCLCDELMESPVPNPHEGNERSLSVTEAVKGLPLMAYIPLGTGNGVGSIVGCQVGWLRGKRRLRRVKEVMEWLKKIGETNGGDETIWEVPMIEVLEHSKDIPKNMTNGGPKKGDLCFFAGIGFDSLMLNDFKTIKAWSKRTGFLTRALSSVAGYCVALVVKTLPKSALYGRHKIKVEVSSQDDETLWIDHRRGDFAHPVKNMNFENSVLNCIKSSKACEKGYERTKIFSGTTGILAAGTSPFYGGGLRLFPFARLFPNKMHLRIGRINPLVGFMNIPKIFEGSYRDRSEAMGCLDFIGGDFEVELLAGKDDLVEGFPFQHSGESMGYRKKFRLRVVEDKVRFVSCLDAKAPVDN